MLGRLRVLLILGLVISPVTANLHHGIVWSEASAQDKSQPAQPLYYFYPWCTYGKFKYYDASGKLYGSPRYWQEPVQGTFGRFKLFPRDLHTPRLVHIGGLKLAGPN